jgi:hypothetical protein
MWQCEGNNNNNNNTTISAKGTDTKYFKHRNAQPAAKME